MPGAGEVLVKAKEGGFTVVLVTGSGQLSLIDRLEMNFPGIFTKDRMITSYDVKHGKPNPEPYLMALQKAGVKPWEAVVIENAPLGVQSASAAGIFTIAINTGPIDDDVLFASGANALLPSMTALSDKWENIVADMRK